MDCDTGDKKTHYPAGMSEKLRNDASAVSNPSMGWSALSLCLAKIIDVYHPEMRCSIEVVYGEHQRPKYTGVEISAASAGARHFLGSIPQKGDICVVGWVANTNQKADRKTPIILTWMPRPPSYGYDWLPVQDFSTAEGILNNPADRQALDQVAQRIRFKMRPMEQGNILASSAQGSDLLLDEGVLLTNRRANEIRLRDQDQAIVMRSLQQFHAVAGARIYTGQVQRDAQHIPEEMISDGLDWSGDVQLNEDGTPLSAFPQSNIPNRHLRPNRLFLKGSDGTTEFEKDGGVIDPYLNPYTFFFEAGLIDQAGALTPSAKSGRLLYGGKSILRMNNRGLDRKERTGKPIPTALSEYRIEVSHTSDGTLPVTEQTDGFDVDRLGGEPPLVEFVLGSVVGNDPFGTGRQNYGIPLGISFADGVGQLVPMVEGDLGEQSATLIKVNPIDSALNDSFVSFTKSGALRAQVSNLAEDAFRAKVEGGAHIEVAGVTRISSAHINLVGSEDGTSPLGVDISSPKGAMRFSAGGDISPNLGASGQDDYEAKMSLILEGAQGISIQAGNTLKLNAPVVDFTSVKTFRFAAQESISLGSGRSMNVEASDYKETITGFRKTTYAGPSDFNPLNPQGSEEVYGTSPATGSVVGAVKKETVVFGDVEKETRTIGSRTTSVKTGDITHKSLLGSVFQKSATNSTEVAPDKISVKALIGNVEVQSIAGSVSITGSLGVGIRSTAKVTLEGSAVVLKAVGGVSGGILCASDLHPIIGKTYQELGLLPRTHLLA